jgi:hypothetical protein
MNIPMSFNLNDPVQKKDWTDKMMVHFIKEEIST